MWRRFLTPPSTDLWHVGILPRTIDTLVDTPTVEDTIWLPAPGNFRFIADPFGVWRDGLLWVFVEALDYRIKRGEIHYYALDTSFTVQSQGVALRAAHHLSYPYLITYQGELYMLPEAYRSGQLTLYRAIHFPDRWEPVATLLDLPAIDASVIQHDGLWWMFFTMPGENQRALRELHVAFAKDLLEPWKLHPMNPVRTGYDASRPGGTPFLANGAVHLPVQDCTSDYGAALHLLRFDHLTPDYVSSSAVGMPLLPSSFPAPYRDGLHTLAQAGHVTLIDGKQILRSHRRHWINLVRKLRRVLPTRQGML